MQPDAAAARVATLLQWSEEAERDPSAGEGHTEVSYQLRRVAKLLAAQHGLPLVPGAEREALPKFTEGQVPEG